MSSRQSHAAVVQRRNRRVANSHRHPSPPDSPRQVESSQQGHNVSGEKVETEGRMNHNGREVKKGIKTSKNKRKRGATEEARSTKMDGATISSTTSEESSLGIGEVGKNEMREKSRKRKGKKKQIGDRFEGEKESKHAKASEIRDRISLPQLKNVVDDADTVAGAALDQTLELRRKDFKESNIASVRPRG